MKKGLLLIILLVVVAGVIWYEFRSGKKDGIAEKKQEPLSLSKNSDTFNVSFARLMDNYYAVRDALVEWDTTKANQATLLVQKSADSLQLKTLKADTLIVQTAANLAASISSEAKGLIGETDIEQKRRSFNMLTDELYNLVRTVQYNGEIVYHTRCPMAFGDSSEAYWLSNSSKVINPYLGKKHPTYKEKMVGCGEVVDSLDFTKK